MNTPLAEESPQLHLALDNIQTVYVSTFLGNRFYPLQGRIDRVMIEDIAHGLAFQCRFNGQTRAFYSVAQHSLMVSSLVPTHLKLAALLHDAAEAYVGDMVKPLKLLLPQFEAIEERVTGLIASTFKVDFGDYRAIKRADLVALATEKRDLMPHSDEAWQSLEGVSALPEHIAPLPPIVAKQAFLAEFRRLQARRPATV